MEDVKANRQATTLVLDANGGLLAAAGAHAAEWMKAVGSPRPVAEVLAQAPALADWLTEQVRRASNGELEGAQQVFLENDRRTHADIRRLYGEGRMAGFAVTLTIEEAGEDGASIVTRKQWHDIRNHLGGLKLYATFLVRKVANEDERDAARKMIGNIDTLIDYIATIRGGQGQ